jgi:hypothetical protein
MLEKRKETVRSRVTSDSESLCYQGEKIILDLLSQEPRRYRFVEIDAFLNHIADEEKGKNNAGH